MPRHRERIPRATSATGPAPCRRGPARSRAVEALSRSMALAPGGRRRPGAAPPAARGARPRRRRPSGPTDARWPWSRIGPARCSAWPRCWSTGSDPQAGLDLVDRGCRLYPDDPRGPRLLGRMYLEQGTARPARSNLWSGRWPLRLTIRMRGRISVWRYRPRATATGPGPVICGLEARPDHDAALRGLARLAELAGEPAGLIPRLAPVVQEVRPAASWWPSTGACSPRPIAATRPSNCCGNGWP